MQYTRQLIEILKNEYRIDASRVYVSGLSLGAMGAWGQLLNYGNYYAAAVVCSGNGNGNIEPNFAQVPTWVFHGTSDGIFDIWQPRNRVNATRIIGGYVVYTEYPGVGHSSGAWGSPGNGRGLCTPGLMAWLTAQIRTVPNTQAPLVAITSPTSSPTFNTPANLLTLSGNASATLPGGTTRTITSVAWSNDRGGSGTAIGTASWSALNIPLLSGANKLQVIATDNQNTSFNQLLTVNLVSDAIAPTVAITSPTTSATLATTTPSLTLGGNASDNIAVTSVTWSNDRGGTGTASGTAVWSVPGITLATGLNFLTVTAKDAANNSASATLSVTYSTPPPINQSPVVSAGANQTITLPATATLNGSVTDDGIAPGNATPSATWSQISGPGSATFANSSATITTVGFSAAGSYVLRLTGSDGVLSSFADVSITVNPAIVVNTPRTVLFDFGGTAETSTGAITSGNWNNVTTPSTGVKITNASDTAGTATSVGLSITTGFGNINYLGSTSTSGIFPATAMQDSFWVANADIAKVKLTGLDPAKAYTLTFFASRMSGGTNRVTAYTVGTATVTLDATDNITNTVALSGVVPLADGSIEFSVKNNINSGYGYLGVLRLDW